MNERIERQDGIVNRIIDGSITIDTIEEFEDLLKVYPHHAALHRAFADMLLEKKSTRAVEEYAISANLFLKAGLPLQAITCKLFAWRVIKPSKEEVSSFHSSLSQCNPQNIEVQKFFTKLVYEEMIALMVKMRPAKYPANTTLKRFGDEEKELFFVVSGALEKTDYHRLEPSEKIQKKTQTNILESDIFGEIYPFDKEKLSESDIESITRVELLRISRIDMTALCEKHPNLNLLMRNLQNEQIKSNQDEYLKKVRRAARHQLPMQIHLKIFQEESKKTPLSFHGFTDDISMGGACIVLGAQYHTGDIAKLTGEKVKMQMSLPVESVNLVILGIIVWAKEIFIEGKKSSILGVQFQDLKPDDREILKAYCCGSEGEQNLIWSLWSSLMEKQLII